MTSTATKDKSVERDVPDLHALESLDLKWPRNTSEVSYNFHDYYPKLFGVKW